MDILKQLYDGEYAVKLPKTPEYLHLRSKNVCKFWDELERRLGSDFLEKTMENLSRQEELENFEYFRQGFRLGAALMLELL